MNMTRQAQEEPDRLGSHGDPGSEAGDARSGLGDLPGPDAWPAISRRGPLRADVLDRAERLEQPLMALLPYGMLVVSAVLTLIVPPAHHVLLALTLAGVTAAWILFVYTLHPAWRERRGVMAVFLSTLLALTATIVVLDPWFGFFSFTGYFFAFWVAAGRWRIVAVCVVAMITGTAQAGGLPKPNAGSVTEWILVMLVNIAVGGGFFWFGWVGETQNARRKELVTRLSEANRKLEASLAENAGLQAQLLAQAREAGMVDERQRMAREIHDTIAQGLAGIITQLQAAERAEQAGPDSERRRHLAAATELARESLSEARRSVDALRPDALQSGRLADALHDVAHRWSLLHRTEAEVAITGTVRPLGPATELVLLRVAQEALANVAKHARASRVGLTLSYMEDQVSLDIRDDGAGFDVAATDAAASGGDSSSRAAGSSLDGGFGLTAMRERVEGIAGSLEIESEPGCGTAISASLPIDIRCQGDDDSALAEATHCPSTLAEVMTAGPARSAP
jgi:signal transduction histidine kinase